MARGHITVSLVVNDERLARIEQKLDEWGQQAAAFFAEERAGRLRIEALLRKLLEKGGATPEELAAVAAAVKNLDAESAALQGATDQQSTSPSTPAKE